MAFAIFSTIVTGFGSQLITGRVWFTDLPWQVHVHAIVFFPSIRRIAGFGYSEAVRLQFRVGH